MHGTEFREGIVANLTADGAVIRRGGTNCHFRLRFWRHRSHPIFPREYTSLVPTME